MAIPKPLADSIDIPAIFIGLDGQQIDVETRDDVTRVPNDIAYEKLLTLETKGRIYTVYKPLGWVKQFISIRCPA